MILKHWEGWVDLKLPALNNQAPRQAIKTSDGREAVEALLSEAERGRGIDEDLDALNREGVRKVREILRL